MLWDGPRAPHYAPMKKQAQAQLCSTALQHSSAAQLCIAALQHSSAASSAPLHPPHPFAPSTQPLHPPLQVLCTRSAPALRPHCQGAIILGIGGDNSDGAVGTFYEGAMLKGYTTDATDDAMQANIVAAGYGK